MYPSRTYVTLIAFSSTCDVSDTNRTRVIASRAWVRMHVARHQYEQVGDIACECGLAIENTVHMMVCSLDDLNSFNDIAKRCVEDTIVMSRIRSWVWSGCHCRGFVIAMRINSSTLN